MTRFEEVIDAFVCGLLRGREQMSEEIRNEPAAAVRVAVAEALAEYTPDQIRAMVELELEGKALGASFANG